MKEYDDTMKEQLEQGVLEIVQNPMQHEGKLYYLPHHPVIKENSLNTKMRIVFDASSGKPSLNDCLFRGKVYAGQDERAIIAIWARIRLMPHILTMDLAKAFLQVVLRKEDRDACRILWPTNPTNNDKPQILRFKRITFGLSPSPYLLGATIEYHLEKYNSQTAKNLIRTSYVDNYILEVKEPDLIQETVKEVRDMFWSAGFNCRQFG
jgi:hypothetical protein